MGLDFYQWFRYFFPLEYSKLFLSSWNFPDDDYLNYPLQVSWFSLHLRLGMCGSLPL